MKRFEQKEIDEILATISTPQETLEWALGNLHPRVAKASSLGAEDSVIIHMMSNIRPDARFLTLDTGRLPDETYSTITTLEAKYKIRFEILYPDSERVSNMVNERGINLFYDSVENRTLCCGIRKVEPLERALAELDGWITGIRRDQTENRQNAALIEIDKRRDCMLKINPLAAWTSEDVHKYIRENDVPYHPLLDQGYKSIGCAPCTRAVKEGESPRSGRWWWEGESGGKECGIHMEHGVGAN